MLTKRVVFAVMMSWVLCASCGENNVSTPESGDDGSHGGAESAGELEEGAGGENCTSPTDCAPGEACTDGRCVEENIDTADCDSDSDSDCDGEEICVQGDCVAQECLADSDCDGEEICENHRCGPAECQADAECTTGQICETARCVTAECSTDEDCGVDEVCPEGRCEDRPPYAAELVGGYCSDDVDFCGAAYMPFRSSECPATEQGSGLACLPTTSCTGLAGTCQDSSADCTDNERAANYMDCPGGAQDVCCVPLAY